MNDAVVILLPLNDPNRMRRTPVAAFAVNTRLSVIRDKIEYHNAHLRPLRALSNVSIFKPDAFVPPGIYQALFPPETIISSLLKSTPFSFKYPLLEGNLFCGKKKQKMAHVFSSGLM